MQLSTAIRDAINNACESVVGTSPIFRTYNGTPPANPAAALSGNTLIAQGTLPSDWMGNSSGGFKSLAGTWTLTGQAGAGAGSASTFFRIYDSTGTTCHWQGPAGVQVILATNALTAANGNVLNFAATAGVVVGMNVSGTGIPAGATVVAVTGTTVTLSMTSTAGVANGATVTFKPDLFLDNNNVASGQTVTVSGADLTAGNA